MGSKKQKKIICRVPPRVPGKEILKKLKKFFAGCRRHLAPGKGPWLKRPAQAKKPLPGARSWGTRQRNLKKIKKILCRVPNGVAPGKGWRPLAAVKPATFAGGHILPSGRHPAKTNFCRRLEFAECPAPGKGWFAGGLSLPGVSRPGTRQRIPLPGAR